ncbi:MAG TPA: DUF4184 family protein [Thermodesulfobacteriota bacterium]|nr:DUF4184 family protein [Thermodesulfobacteriota bacterium]
MPFTPAHSVAVVPLYFTFRKHLVLSALIIGSMFPDFEYILRLAATSRISHTFYGLFSFCLPVGLLTLWLFHSIVKRPALLFLPDSLRIRLERHALHFPFLPLRRFLEIAVSIVLGAFTHIVWDSFTHKYGWVAERLPLLQMTALTVAGHDLQVYKILRHGSTLVGLSLLAYWTWRWFMNEPVQAVQVKAQITNCVKYTALAALLFLTCVIGLSIGFWSTYQATGFLAMKVFIVRSALGGMAAFSACVLSMSIVFRVAGSRLTNRSNRQTIRV